MKEERKTKRQLIEELRAAKRKIARQERRFRCSLGDQISDALFAATDITDRRRMEQSQQESEEKFRAIYNNASDGIIIADPRTKRFLSMNASMIRMLGIAQDDVTDLGVADIHPAEALPYVAGAFEKCARNEADYFDNIPMLRKDGSVFIAEVTASWIRLRDANYLVGFFRDVTERRLAEDAIRASEENLQKIIDGSAAVIFAKDLEGRYLFINARYEKLFHVSKSDIIGKTDYAIFPADAASAFREADKNALQADRPIETEEAVPQDDGIHYYLSLKFPLHDKNEKPYAVCGIATDITERKLIQDALQQTTDRLRESLQEKDILLKEVHHRVKNNLQIIASLLYFQSKKISEPTSLAALDEARDRLRSMILVHEKLYQSQDLARVDMRDYIRTLIDQLLISHAMQGRNVRFRQDILPIRLPIEVALPIGMIISELVTNIYKYAFPDGAAGEAAVQADHAGGALRISISDSGIGIPDGVNTDQPATFGLQLVGNLVQQLNGTLSIDRARGTRVVISIPAIGLDKGDHP